ncbi:phage tail protein [Actinomadura rayongensis]|uniref:Tape-measure protein n=1 Tax=Actinomadura rayongensis TaxID=1429076 RepID=A0A6I4W5C7_9ACTN|nr:hypothetical protein [Actinomadura rayongensis]MXQ63960.1 hypothetical protein [Actinomadura rayongensis]
MSGSLSRVAQGLAKVRGSALRASTAFERLNQSARHVGSGLSSVQGGARRAAAGATAIKGQVSAAGTELGNLERKSKGAGSGVASMQKQFGTSGRFMSLFKKNLSDTGMEATKSGKQLGNAGKGMKAMGPAGKIAGTGLKGLGAGFKAALGPAGLILMLLQPFLEKLVESVMKSKTFQKIVSQAMKIVSNSIKWVKDAAKVVWDWIKQNWPLLLAIITGPFGIAVYVIKKYWSNIKAGAIAAKDYVVEKFQALVGFFRALPGKILSGIGNVGRTLYNKGKDLIMGFVNGIKSMAGHIVDVIKNTVTDKIPGFVKKALGINSPSLVMMALGEGVGEGMALGIDGSKKHVDKSLGKLVDVPKTQAVRAQGSVLGKAVAGSVASAGRGKSAGAYEFHFHGAVKDPKETSRQFASRLRSWEILNSVR